MMGVLEVLGPQGNSMVGAGASAHSHTGSLQPRASLPPTGADSHAHTQTHAHTREQT